MAAYPEYLWIAIVGSFFAFWYAFGIGANDVANAFGSTVASKSLTLKQAVIAAGIFEFSGAILLGAAVTNTIRSKVVDIDIYEGEEPILMLGMFTSIITATVMLIIATAVSLPVSTTQTVVGCIMGFSIAAKGFESVNRKVFIQILLSWVLSPGISGVLGFLFFGFIKVVIHRSSNSYQRAYLLFPLILTIFIGVILFYVFYKAVSTNNEDALSLAWVLPASFGAGALCGLIWIVILGPIAKKRINAKFDKPEADKEVAMEVVEGDEDAEKTPEEAAAPVEETTKPDDAVEKHVHNPVVDGLAAVGPVSLAEVAPQEEKSFMARMSTKFVENTYGQDLETQSFHENKASEEIWAKAEQYDPHTEEMFTYVQVFTACMNSFAHGANDVANSIAPMSAIIMIYQTGELSSKTSVQKWILAYGGFGIVVGLLCYGYKIMRTIGYKLVALSPSRGSCAELAASLYVVTASFLEIPVSSTQCIVGAVCGVGLVGGINALSWWFFLRICIGWVLEFFTAITLSAGIFSMFAFSPSLMYD